MEQFNASGQPVTLIHLAYPISATEWRIACMPGMTEFHQTPHHPNYQRTNDTRAITCPGCKATAVYKSKIGTVTN